MIPEQAYYETAAMWDPARYNSEEEERFQTFTAQLPADVASLLDVGCGNGLFLRHLARQPALANCRLSGVDRSQAALDQVVGETYRASVDDLPFADQEFDAVTCMEVLEHLPGAVFQQALRELARVARRYILVGLPFNEHLRSSLIECPACCCRFNPHYHLRSFDEAKVRPLFDAAGFDCRAVFHVLPVRVIPASIVLTWRTLAASSRRMLGRPPRRLPEFSVCPACGCTASSQMHERPSAARGAGRWWHDNLAKLLSVQPTHRWIGALFCRCA
jgi:SAM-dependent methyltransferase